MASTKNIKQNRRRSTMNEEKKLNHNQAADFLGIKPQTLYNWRHQRKGPDYVLMGKKVIYLKSDLDSFIESNKIRLN